MTRVDTIVESLKDLTVGERVDVLNAAGRLIQSDSASYTPKTGTDPDDRLTDVANARRLIRAHGEDMRYCPPWRDWLVWDGRRWARDETGEVERRAKATVRGLYREAERIDDGERRREFIQKTVRSESQTRIASMVSLARTEEGVAVLPDDLDRDPWLLNVLNGTVDLRTGELRPHSRGDLITKLAPVEFDPEAECPTWLGFLHRIMDGDEARIEFLRRAIGYSLTGDTREQVMFILYGTGANGKSTLLNTVTALLGDYARHTTADTLLVRRADGPRDDLARLHGARFVSAVEAEVGRRLAETLVKQLTGGDPITARFLYRDLFTFQPTFKLFLAVNHKPIVKGTDYAIWRRIRLLPFTVTIPEHERDRGLGERLRQELPGILRWAVGGALAWQREGLGLPPAVDRATREYRSEMDTFAAFLDARTEEDADGWVPTEDLYAEYAGWSRQAGERQVTLRTFVLMLKERGFQNRKRRGERGWEGLRLREDDDEPAPRRGRGIFRGRGGSRPVTETFPVDTKDTRSKIPESPYRSSREGSFRKQRSRVPRVHTRPPAAASPAPTAPGEAAGGREPATVAVGTGDASRPESVDADPGARNGDFGAGNNPKHRRRASSPSTGSRAGSAGARHAASGSAADAPFNDRRCIATTKDGRPCRIRPLAGRQRCLTHEAEVDPAVGEKLALSRRLGGLTSTAQRALPPTAGRPDLRTRDGVRDLLEETAQAVLEGKIPPSVANSVAQLATVGLRLVELELDAEELLLAREAAARESGRRIIVQEGADG